jgi:hypothetical protein
MQVEQIVTLANKSTELEFRAMERSLRATGCTLPLQVIPYDESRFDLPTNANWLEDDRLFGWLAGKKCNPAMRRYVVLTLSNYQVADTDIIFIANPEDALRGFDGFVVCCTEWRKADWTYVESSKRVFESGSSVWKSKVFNSGQFACSHQLYTDEELTAACEHSENRACCLEYPLHEQPGLNLLVALKSPKLTNLTLPPYSWPSSWAGDYEGDFRRLWDTQAAKPYLVHYAGRVLDWDLPINELFYDYLTRAEREVFDSAKAERRRRKAYLDRWPQRVRLINRLLTLVDSRFYVQPLTPEEISLAGLAISNGRKHWSSQQRMAC